jgi:hypothetical protein
MANPAAQMLKILGKLVWVLITASVSLYFQHFKQFFRLYSIKSLYCFGFAFWQFCFLALD